MNAVMTAYSREEILAKRQYTRKDLIGAGILLLLLSCTFYINFFLPVKDGVERLKLHQEVLANQALAAYQYQMYIHDQIMEVVFQAMPQQSDHWFALTYMLYYGTGLVIFLLVLFRFCSRIADTSSALVACLYLVAVLPIFWYDNYYHPGDPWGALLAVLLVQCVLLGYRNWRYYGLLLLSGFVWEKCVLLPFSVAVADYLQGERPRRTIAKQFAVALLCAVIGQILLRLLLGTNRGWAGTTLAYNISKLYMYVWGMAVVFGLPIWYTLRCPQKIPLILRALVAQFPVWLAIYLVFNGVIKEMRSILVMVSYTWPILALAMQDWLLSDSTMPVQPTPGLPAGSES